MPTMRRLHSHEFKAPYVRVRGRVSKLGQVTWTPCLRTLRPPHELADRPATESYRVALEDARGRTLETAMTDVSFVETDPQWTTFVARLPYRKEARHVALYRGTAKLGAMPVLKAEPAFAVVQPLGSADIDPDGCVHLRWKATGKTRLTYYVRFSADGKRWYRLAVNLRGEGYVLDLRPLPGGRRCRLQILATNGYHTHYVELPPFALPVKPPELLVGDPRGPVLFAQGFSYERGPLVGDAIAWLSDGRDVARGGTFDVRRLREGVHEVAVALSVAGKERRREVLGRYDGVTGRMVGRRG